MSHTDRRKQIIQKIKNTIGIAWQRDLEVDEEKLIAVLGSDEGASRRTAMDYIRCAKKLLEEEKKQNQLTYEEERALNAAIPETSNGN